ncbi:hypothetical protein GCM10029978_008930 [Actinoallomurus acanthiterrae]
MNAAAYPAEKRSQPGTVGGIGKGNKIDYDKFQTYTLRRRDGRWECVAFQVLTHISWRSR